MAGFEIITDTSCNLPTPLLRKLRVGEIAFTYTMEGQELSCTDTESFDGKAFFDKIREGEKVSTSQITPQHYIDYLEPMLKEGKDVLFVGMSSGISGSCSSARFAAEELSEMFPERTVRVVDSLSASLAEGMVVLKACQLRDRGIPLEEAAETLEKYRMRICQVFTVADLKHLQRTGRLSRAKAVIGSILNIKPILIGDEEGKIVLEQNTRGRRNAIKALAEKFRELVADKITGPVCIAHADCAEDAEFLVTCLKKIRNIKDILVVMYEPVTGAHVGPGTLALFYEGEENARLKL